LSLPGPSDATDNPFGYVVLEPYPRVGSTPYALDATVVLQRLHLSRVSRVLVQITEHSANLEVTMGTPRTRAGQDIAVLQDEPGASASTLFLDGRAVSDLDGSFVVPIELRTTSDGRFHFGLYVAGFDEQWNLVTVAPGVKAETFASSAVSGFDHPRGLFAAPFQGDGNAIPGPSTGLSAFAVVALVLGLRRRGKIVDEHVA
jgi:hypothetical protein